MKQLLVLLLLLCSASVSAQDVIVKKDGSMIDCQVVELTESEIVYKKWSDQNGSNYVMERSAASAINYQNGKKVNLSEATNLYEPNNQNDGVQKYNDKALLLLDASSIKYNPSKRAKTLRTIGWIGGTVLSGVAIAFFISGGLARSRGGEENSYYVGGISAALAVIGTPTLLLMAHHYQKKADFLMQSSSLYQYNFKFDDGSFLSAGIDMLCDRTINKNTLGFGIRYNFQTRFRL